MRVVEISSAANPRVRQVVRLRQQRHRRRTGLLIAEGQREVVRALAAGLAAREVWMCRELLERHGLGEAADELARRMGAEVVHLRASARVFEKVAYVREPEGVLAVFEQPAWSVDGLPAVSGATLYLVAVGVEKPGNLGAMVRTAEAAGCQAVYVAGAVVDAYNPNAIRTSTGAVFTTPVLAMGEAEVREHLRAAGVRLALATPGEATPHTRFDWRGPVAVVIGPEDEGLGEAWLEAEGAERVRIEMRGKVVDSLNASNAAAVLLFEALRQRG